MIKLTDDKIIEEAHERVAFQRHLRVYLIITALTWLMWYFTRAQKGHVDGYWPIYSTLGWGFGVLMHYFGVYHKNESAVEKEIDKIKKERGLS